MIEITLVLVIGFLKVSARAFQQKNVMYDRWVSIIPTSYVMAFMEIAMAGISVIKVMEDGWFQIIPVSIAYGTGSWIGCWIAIWFHKKVHK